MKIHRHWARETRSINGIDVTSKAGSDVSFNDAKRLLDEKFAYIARFYASENISAEEREAARLHFAGGKTGCEYESPICEEFVREIDTHNIITRNRYGALILNTEDHCFIDVDNEPPEEGLLKLLTPVFGYEPTPLERMLLKLEKASSKNDFAGLSFRLYETAAGFRILVKGTEIAPDSDLAGKLFCYLGADRLYEILCVKQNCYRARLTPKPRRIRMPRMGCDFRYPYENPDLVKKWTHEYQQRIEKYAVCRLAGEFGTRFTTPVTEIHDAMCGTAKQLQLA